MASNKYISKVIQSEVESMKTCSNFEFGYWHDVSNRLLNKNLSQSSQAVKYPLIVLHAKFVQKRNDKNNSLIDCNPTIYIVTRTQPKLTHLQRVDETFSAILEPIYEELLKVFSYSTNISSIGKEGLEHDREDLFFASVGESNKNILPEHLDVIQLKFSNLKIFREC